MTRSEKSPTVATSSGTGKQCPECGNASLARVRSDAPWCPACEWNLAWWPDPVRKKDRRRIQRDRRRAFALNRQLEAEFLGRRPGRPHTTRAGALLAVASLLLFIFDLALVGFGSYLIATAPDLGKVLGLVLILIAVECRPRLPKLDATVGRVNRTDAPGLFSIIDAAAASVHAPRVDIVVIEPTFNAACMRSGIRRHTVLLIGLQLWTALSPAGREAVLGHELGHLVNRDPRTGFVNQLALTTFARLADIFAPISGGDVISELVTNIVFAPLRFVFVRAHGALERIAAGDHQRAEVYADALSANLGGAAGADELTRLLLLLNRAAPAFLAAAKTSKYDPAAVRAAVAAAVDVSDKELKLAEQASLRYDAQLYASHPPDGLRRRLVMSWPQVEATHTISSAWHAEADAELRPRYVRAARALAR